ncbi:MAG: hypothetical protein ABSD20_15345 [Terriglobales bacterium]|jgi:hypothetical protein
MSRSASDVAGKLEGLSSEQLAEVDYFVEFIRHRDQERAFSRAAAIASTPEFAAIWNIPEDEVYDTLSVR